MSEKEQVLTSLEKLPSLTTSNKCSTQNQGGRAWQPFVRGKNGHENFHQARIYNFRVKCVAFACNRKFAKLTE